MQFSEFYVTSTRKTGSFVQKSGVHEKKIHQTQQQLPAGLTCYDCSGTRYRSTVSVPLLHFIVRERPEWIHSACGHQAH